jgi:hypothetical protein
MRDSSPRVLHVNSKLARAGSAGSGVIDLSVYGHTSDWRVVTRPLLKTWAAMGTVRLLLMTYPSGFGGASSTVRDVVHFDISLPCGCCARVCACPSAVRPGESLRRLQYASSIDVSDEQMILLARLAASSDALHAHVASK